MQEGKMSSHKQGEISFESLWRRLGKGDALPSALCIQASAFGSLYHMYRSLCWDSCFSAAEEFFILAPR